MPKNTFKIIFFSTFFLLSAGQLLAIDINSFFNNYSTNNSQVQSQNYTQNTNTESGLFSNFLNKIGFGNKLQQPTVQNTIPTPTFSTPNMNSNIQIQDPFVPQIEIMDFAAPFKTQATGTKINNTKTATPTKTTSTAGGDLPQILNTTVFSNDTVKADLEKKICANLIAKGYKFKDDTCGASAKIDPATQVTTQSTVVSPQQEQQINKNLENTYGQNPYTYNQNYNGGYDFSACQFATNKQQCQKELQISCAQAYRAGEYYLPECTTVPKSTYANSVFGSEPAYYMNNYLSDPATANYSRYLSQNYQTYTNNFNSNFSPKAITGAATQYGCMNGRPDNFLISTYKYISAFGKKVRYGTNVGDSVNACNFNYCGVAVSLPYIQRTYGSRNAGANKMVKIVNTGNYKCVIAPIQDISSVKTEVHAGSNAIMDLSECAMKALGGSGKIRVNFSPVMQALDNLEGTELSGCVVLNSK